MNEKIEKLIELANTHPNHLNGEGKENLALSIIEYFTEEELDKFLIKYGYSRTNEKD